MKRNLGDIIQKSANRVSLSESERERMERVVLGYVSMKPIRSGGTREVQVHWYQWVRQPLAIGLVFALVVSGTGVSYAAEASVPGDLLYPIKVSVNEEVRASLTFSGEEKGKWETERAERRLEEAATLAVQGKLTTEVKKELVERFDTHSERAVASAESFEDNDALLALNLASDFESRLKAHEELLEEVDDDDRRIIDNVRKKLARAVSLRHRAEGKLAFAPSAKMIVNAPAPEMALMMTAEADPVGARVADFERNEPSEEQNRAVAKMRELAERSYKDADGILAKTKGTLDENQIQRAELSLSHSQELLDEGDASVVAGQTFEALDSYRESVATSQRLSVFLKASEHFEFKRVPDVRFNVGSDDDGSEGERDDSDNESNEDELDSTIQRLKRDI